MKCLLVRNSSQCTEYCTVLSSIALHFIDQYYGQYDSIEGVLDLCPIIGFQSTRQYSTYYTKYSNFVIHAQDIVILAVLYSTVHACIYSLHMAHRT